MATRLRISPFLRRAAVTAAFGALLVPAGAGAATAEAAAKKKVKLPVITGVKPMDVAVGEVLEIRGRNFVRGRNRNSVVFKRDGGKAVFIKASVGTAKLLKVTIPASLQKQFALSGGVAKPTRFRLRVLAKKFGKSFTRTGLSPTVSAPRPPVPPGFVESQPDGDCDGDGAKNKVDSDDDNDGLTDVIEQSLNLNPCVADTDGDGLIDRWEFDCDRNGVLNRDETDSDKDLLPDTTENTIGTDFCNNDTDGDGVEDGFEFQSARDLNDDDYQEINQNLPYPGARPYPNPLFKDGDVDYDGDVLTLREEQALWHYTYEVTRTDTRTLTPLSYSDGTQHSRYNRGADGRRVPSLPAANYSKQNEFINSVTATGYRKIQLENTPQWIEENPGPTNEKHFYGLLDVDRSGPDPIAVNSGENSFPEETLYFDFDRSGSLSDDERDEDSDGLTNYDETHGRMTKEYWSGCYTVETPYLISYAGTNVANADSDGDGVVDGADDVDHDDIPNIMELSRIAASGINDNEVGSICKPKTGLATRPLTEHPREFGQLNPFNPCLPATFSPTCPKHPNSLTGAPFDGSPYWYSLN
jgi:hypothetical protein